MNITIIGTGNTATVLARLCVQKGHTIHEIIARNEHAAKDLVKKAGGRYINIRARHDADTDLVIVALSDGAIPDAIQTLHFKNATVVHTAGAVSIDVLRNISANYGVLYPLQSLRKDMVEIPPIPFMIEANNAITYSFIKEFAESLGSPVHKAGEEERLRLHTAAVVVNNFTNYLYTLAEDFCKKESIDFNLLQPLIMQTAERITDYSPADAQTGPALRNDTVTIRKHLQLLKAYPGLHHLYKVFTEAIRQKAIF